MKSSEALKIIKRLEPIAKTYPSRSKQRRFWYQCKVMCGDKYEWRDRVPDSQINGLIKMLEHPNNQVEE